ncbi:MAG: hypothetical protein LC749_21865 [Actinobacteria bacterium]|nr:hypothetical protein [Actinomycetota bacterium]
MARSLRLLAVALIAAATLALPTAASAAPASTSFTVTGFEYAFTQTVGFFAGSAVGNAGDRGTWNTYVEHDPLGTTPTTYVNGGSFWMATRSPAGTYDWVTGTFAYHGGTITTMDPGENCTNQRYLVTGTLKDVATSTTTGGSGAFSVTLTHYRASLFGRCIIYSASMAGTVTFDY